MQASVEEDSFTILGIDHIGIAPKDWGAAKDFLQKHLHLPLHAEEKVAEQEVDVAMFASQGHAAPAVDPAQGFNRLELLRPLAETGPIASYLTKKGGGIHHLALRVDNLERALAALKKQGVALIDEQPRVGVHHSKVAFIHRRAAGGILIELVEYSS